MLQYSYRSDPPPTRRSGRHGDRDQSWAQYSAIVDRPRLRWPNDCRLALWVCPNVLWYEYVPDEDPWLNAWTRMPPPDVMGYGRQEYGNRVGFWRMLEVLDRYEVRCTAVVNSGALRLFPRIAAAIAERGWDVLGHGAYNTRFIYGYTEEQERRYYREMIREVESLTGVRMAGMGGPGPQAATESTPDLLAEEGFLYHADWFFDDQPFPLQVRGGRLIAMPYSVEINDSPVLASAFEADDFLETVKRQFDRLYAEGADSGRVMCISLHPVLFGQPQRIRYLEAALEYVLSFPGVWQATGEQIARHYLEHGYEPMVRHLAAAGGGSRP